MDKSKREALIKLWGKQLQAVLAERRARLLAELEEEEKALVVLSLEGYKNARRYLGDTG